MNRTFPRFDPEVRAREALVMHRLVEQLESAGARILFNSKTVGTFRYRLQFYFDYVACVTIEINLKDWQCDSDVVITTMTVLPITSGPSVTGKGYGTKALVLLLDWMRANKLQELRAAQVRRGNEGFWQKNLFSECPPPNPTRDFVYKITF